MLHASGKYTCDAELGGPGHWRGCKRKAVIAREAKLVTLHYCARHRGRAVTPQRRHFEPKPGSQPYLLRAA